LTSARLNRLERLALTSFYDLIGASGAAFAARRVEVGETPPSLDDQKRINRQ
jgi:hypothetical protein